MKIIIKISKLFQIFLILCFFLPFVKSCKMGPSEEEIDAKRQDSIRRVDSIYAIQGQIDSAINKNIEDSINGRLHKNDTINKNELNISKNSKEKQDTITENNIEFTTNNELTKNSINQDTSYNIAKNRNLKKNYKTDTIINKFHFLKPLLRPNDDHSGIGYIIDWSPEFISYFGIFLAFILLLQGMIFKFLNYSKYYVVHLTGNIISLLFLFLFELSIISESFLWGYWTTIWLLITVLIGDIILKIKYKKAI